MKEILRLLLIFLNLFIANGQTPCSNTTPCITSFGTQLGSFNGVNAYSNCSWCYDSQTYNYEVGINTGLKYQCVEFVNRYYKVIYGLDLRGMGVFGNANSYYSNATAAGLTAYANGGSISPQVGDILCSNGGTYGHVAIVKNVTTSSIDVIEQNFSNAVGGCYATLTRSGNTISGFSSNYPVTGWIRNQTGTNAPTITSVSPNPVSGSNSIQTLTINGSNFTSGCTITLKDLTNGGTYTKNTTFINSSQIQISANFTNNTATWSVQVATPSTSNIYQFQVNATPTITSVSPNPVTGSNSIQTITINGSNFTTGCIITLIDLTNGGTYTKSTTFINSSQIQISANFTNNTATWSIQVATPISSNIYQFQVIINGSASVDDFSNNLGIQIFPNPINEYLNISSNIYQIKEISLYTLDGKLIETEKIKGINKYRLNLSNYLNALYFLTITSEIGSQSFKVIKN